MNNSDRLWRERHEDAKLEVLFAKRKLEEAHNHYMSAVDQLTQAYFILFKVADERPGLNENHQR